MCIRDRTLSVSDIDSESDTLKDFKLERSSVTDIDSDNTIPASLVVLSVNDIDSDNVI